MRDKHHSNWSRANALGVMFRRRRPMPVPHPRKPFSQFSLADAYKRLGLTQLQAWQPDPPDWEPSLFFNERLRRLQYRFDLRSSEAARLLLIDALLEEALEGIDQLKVWKGAPLKGKGTAGYVDYLVAPRRDYLERPLLCVVEAKDDDFEQGLAQCLVELQACAEQNLPASLTLFGCVSNGEAWRFYQYNPDPLTVLESSTFGLAQTRQILGLLHDILSRCATAVDEWNRDR